MTGHERLRSCSDFDGRPKVLRVSEIVTWPEPAASSLGPGARELDHLGPFLSIVDDELAELGRGRRHGRAAEVGKARLQVASTILAPREKALAQSPRLARTRPGPGRKKRGRPA